MSLNDFFLSLLIFRKSSKIYFWILSEIHIRTYLIVNQLAIFRWSKFMIIDLKALNNGSLIFFKK